jgi:hypothetical protein
VAVLWLRTPSHPLQLTSPWLFPSKWPFRHASGFSIFLAIVPDFPTAPNLVSLDHFGCLGSSHPSTGMSNNLPVSHRSIDMSQPLPFHSGFIPSIPVHSGTLGLHPPPLWNSIRFRMPQLFSHGSSNPLPGSFLRSFMATSFPVAFQPFPPVRFITSPYLQDLLPTPETPLWLRFQMPQFLSHGFGNPPSGSFLVSFMAASFHSLQYASAHCRIFGTLFLLQV